MMIAVCIGTSLPIHLHRVSLRNRIRLSDLSLLPPFTQPVFAGATRMLFLIEPAWIPVSTPTGPLRVLPFKAIHTSDVGGAAVFFQSGPSSNANSLLRPLRPARHAPADEALPGALLAGDG